MAEAKKGWLDSLSDFGSWVSGTATDILNSDAATAYIEGQAQQSAQEFAADQAAKQAKIDAAKKQLPPWAVFGGIGLAVVLTIVLIISMARRR